MAGYLIGIYRYLRMRKSLLITVSYSELKTMSLNAKLSKVVSYIQYNKSWEKVYLLLKILPPFLQVLRISDSNKSGMYKVYYSRMKNISIIKSSSDIDNEELFPVSRSSSLKVCRSSYSDTEEKENIDTDDPDSR